MAEMAEGRIIVEKLENHVTKVTMDRPPVNAFSTDMFGKMYKALQEIAEDRDCHCVVFCSSSQKMFSAGSDVNQYPGMIEDPLQKKMFRENQVWNMIECLPQPTIAAIEGTVCGGGLELAVSCDMRIMSESGRAAYPEINLGLFPCSGGLFRTAKLIGPSKTLELSLTGAFISAEECLKIGLVNKLAPAGTVIDAAVELAEVIASKPFEAVEVVKKATRETWLKDSEEAFYRNLIYVEALFKTPNGKEGIYSFLEKRPPHFE